jgi:uncharacterized protein (TIGR03435 family)
MTWTAWPTGAFRRLLLLAVVALPTASQPQTQAPLNVLRQFEVASIKLSKPGAVVQDARIAFPPSRFEAVNVTLNDILASMSGFMGKVQGGPKWTESERYDIVAKADGYFAPGQRNQMVMALLEDRFKLAVHHEEKEAPGLSLAVGKRPPNLASSKDNEETLIRSGDRRQVIFQGVTMGRLANYLGQIWHVTVVNRTGLTGKFDFSLDPDSYATEPVAQSPLRRESFGDLVRAAVEHLGFTVETRKVTIDITVIDHAERPSEN